jgi:chromosome segregation ATPase
VKRRFVRQNREIARANSIQSLRIQSLESEVSHLLRENAELREQLISLSQDVEKFEAAKSLSNEICTYKDKLALKLTELGDLVDELGKMPQKFGRASELQKDSFRSERQQSSVVPPRRTEIGPNGSEEDGRLPVILEDKYFPRRTLECVCHECEII